MLYQGLSGFQIKHHIELYIHQILSNKKGLYQVFDYIFYDSLLNKSSDHKIIQRNIIIIIMLNASF